MRPDAWFWEREAPFSIRATMEGRLVATQSVDRKAEEAIHGRSSTSASAYGVPGHIKVLVDLTTYLH